MNTSINRLDFVKSIFMLKLVSVNIETDRHLDLALPFLLKENPDVICLQEVFAVDLHLFEEKLGMQSVFSPVVNIIHPVPQKFSTKGFFGCAILTKTSFLESKANYYAGNGENIKPWDGNIDNHHRALLVAKIEKEGQIFQIATTHFTWTPNGNTSAEQLEDFAKMAKILKEIGSCILVGDFNAPRGKEIFSALSKLYKDNIPGNYTTSLDPDLHKIKNLQLVVDGLFTSPEYVVNSVHLQPGVSDHQAIVAEIERI